MRLCLAALGILLVLGCGSPTPDSMAVVVLDLAESLDRAEVRIETGLIDVGTPGARSFLGRGWSWNEQEKSGTTFAWSSRHSSALHFFLVEPRPLRIRFRCKPFHNEPSVVESLSLGINGHPAGTVVLRRGWEEYDLELPGEFLQRGINRIVLEYEWREGSPTATRKRGQRQVAVAWDWIRFPAIGSDRHPSTTATRGLTLTAGSQVDFYLTAPGATVLRIDAVESSTPGGGLEITSLLAGETESEPSRPVVFESPEKDLRIQVTEKAGLARLRVLATGDFELTQPRVVADATPGQPVVESRGDRSPTLPPVRPPLILVYLIDTLRADHLTPYHYARDTSPGLTRLMADAVVFEDVIAQSSWTKPATASILTGHLPWSHGAESNRDALTGRVDSLAHHLSRAGYRTGGFSANGNIAEVFGFHHGFDHFSLMGQFDASAAMIHEQALQWLTDQDTANRVFLYAHTIDPHTPYLPSASSSPAGAAGTRVDPVGSVPFMRLLAASVQQPDPELLDKLIDLYDGEIAYSDRLLTELVEVLKDRGLYDRSLILVLSDHGEEFYDHGSWTHGRTLHREVLHVPLLIKFPGNWGAATRVAETAQQIDILPTILDSLGLPPPPGLAGKSLLCAVQQSMSETDLACETDLPRPIFSSVHYHQNRWLGITLGDWKLILRGAERLDREAKLFHRSRDPEERQNIAALHPVRVGYLTSLIRIEKARRDVESGSKPVELDPETRERLEALGYLN